MARGFAHLEWLKLYLWEDVKKKDPYAELAFEFGLWDGDDETELPNARASDHFPAEKYADNIKRYLAPLPRLKVVEVDIAGNQADQDEYREDYGPDFAIAYTFSIVRDSDDVQVLLVDVVE